MKRFLLSVGLGVMFSASTLLHAQELGQIQAQEQSVQGVDHVGLAVSDLKASERFFTQYAGFHVLSRDEKYPSVFLSNNSVVITLWRVTDPSRAVAFDRKHNVGLHHLALRVSSEATLNALHDTFVQDKQVKIEFAPELAGNGPNKHMMVYEPSGNRIEFMYRVAAR
ncbi:VOC family protein [Paraglaciecola chathamensis]|uniref:VOC family protein n=1 Tax=Paraglaciecola chathamensis TaxID=368405 RepID=A0ABS0WI69_9ALTE|nr:VOC family protein [Paraglaciecola chathamensis]MBJ2138141.1 VOC family protein [Paraglaciecola chathamensis]